MSNKKQDKMGRYRERALDPNEVPMRRLRAAKSLVELAGYSQRTCPVGRRVSNELIAPGTSDEIRKAAIKLLEDIAVGEAARKNALLTKIKIGETIYQDGVAYRVTEVSKDGRVIAAEEVIDAVQPEQGIHNEEEGSPTGTSAW